MMEMTSCLNNKRNEVLWLELCAFMLRGHFPLRVKKKTNVLCMADKHINVNYFFLLLFLANKYERLQGVKFSPTVPILRSVIP